LKQGGSDIGPAPLSTTAFSRTSDAQMMLFWSYQHLDWISPRPVLFITGDQAHARIFSEHAYSRASEPKELLIVPGAGHVDLYDRVGLIPWERLQAFFDTASGRGEGGLAGLIAVDLFRIEKQGQRDGYDTAFARAGASVGMHETLRPADGHCRDDVFVCARVGRNARG